MFSRSIEIDLRILTFKCKINIIRGKSKKNPGYIINIIYTSVYL